MSKKRQLEQDGFGHVVLLVILVLVVTAIFGFAFHRMKSMQSSSTVDANNSIKSTPTAFMWQQRADGWQALETPPKCSTQPLLSAPVDISKATSVLYPGQTRGNYKPHGGLRFDNSTNNTITVKSPIDGFIVKSSRNFAQGTTEVQYGFDIMNNCGIMTRFGHLRELPGNLQTIVNKLPEPTEDSRVENINPPIHIKQGDVLATKVGLISEKNTFFDWGVYDYRQQNQASQSATYKAAHPQKELDWYGVCWIKGWLPAKDESRLLQLPGGSGENGKTSDYCK